jgi:protein-disulfide isomerase
VNQNKAVIAGAAAVLVIVLGVLAYFLMGANGGPEGRGATAFERELLVAGPLGDMTKGNPDAPVTVIEYASLTCNHCASFAINTLPHLIENYVETGQVYYILRDFPYDPIATAGFMLSHCAGEARYFGFVDTLFERQAQWAFTQTPLEDLKSIARQGGFSEERFDQCMQDQNIFNHVREVATRGRDTFGVRSTPTFFINGEKVEGALPWAEFEPLIKKALADRGATPASAAQE